MSEIAQLGCSLSDGDDLSFSHRHRPRCPIALNDPRAHATRRGPKTGSSRRMALVELQLFGGFKMRAGEIAGRARLPEPRNLSKWRSNPRACA